MTIRSGLNKKLHAVMSHEDGVVLIPFGFTINGTTTPDGVIGDLVDSVAYNEAGEFLVTLKCKVAKCFGGFAEVSSTADDVDITGKVDWALAESAGTFVVRTMTGAVQTNPTDNLLVGGALIVSKTTRTGRR